MIAQNCLGIYLSRDRAVVVCLGLKAGRPDVIGCFAVSSAPAGQPGVSGFPAIAEQVAQLCWQRSLKFSDAAVALDCALFMQHSVHSGFTDPSKVASTVRYDAEETLATDISTMAIAFKLDSAAKGGANLTVFTAEQQVLSDVILALESNDIDPVVIEPDVSCLAKYLRDSIPHSGPDSARTLYALLSDRRGYLVAQDGSGRGSLLRAFLIGSTQNRTQLVAREGLITTALRAAAEPITHLALFDSAGGAAAAETAQRLGLQQISLDLPGAADVSQEASETKADPVDIAIAYGAALSAGEKTHDVNFRDDYLPFLGRKVRLRKAVKFFSVCLVVLMLSLGGHFQMKLMQVNHYRSDLRDRLEPDYLAVTLGKSELPAKMKTAVSDLEKVKRGIEAVQGKGGLNERDAILAKLTMILDAFNSCAATTGLDVQTVSVTPTGIAITGETSERKDTLRLEEAIKKSGLKIEQERLGAKDGRDSFSFTIAPEKTG